MNDTNPRLAAPARGPRTHHLRQMKERGEKWAMLTAYEQYAAQTFDEAGIPVLLVGDSACNIVFGNETSLPVTVDELIPLSAPSPGRDARALVVADLPFGSYQARARAGVPHRRPLHEGGATRTRSSSRAAREWCRRSS